MNWKIWGAVAVVAVIAVVLLGAQKSTAPEPITTGQPVPGETVNAPTAAGTPASVDGIVNAILADAAQDQALVQAEDANADLAIQDTADLNDLGAAYTDNEF